VWLLKGPKAGDVAQMRTLAGALTAQGGWCVAEKPLRFRRHELLLHLVSRPTLAGLDCASRRGLVPPWPDLVLTAGRRNELVARWIRQRSGGRTRLVHLGRPWSRPERFDLVISTPQYQLAPAPNVLVIPLPLHRLDRAALAAAAERWRTRLAPLPRPWIAVLVGGNSGPFVFTPALAEHLAGELNALAAARGGSLLVTTSPRTPAPFTRRLRGALRAGSLVHEWSGGGGANPYPALLALADRFVVTAESMSMITEALATGRPVQLAPVTLPGARPWWLRVESFRWKPLSHRLAMAVAPARFTRDVGRIHRALVDSGRATWLGQGEAPGNAPEDSLAVTLDRVLARVLAMMDGARQGS
jgi:hypothetical protein